MHDQASFRLGGRVDMVTGAGGGRAAGLACNVTAEAVQPAVMQAATDRFGRVDIPVSGTGGDRAKPSDRPLDIFRRAFERNPFSLLRLSQHAALRVEASGRGAIRTAAPVSVQTPDIEMAMLKHMPPGRLGAPSDISHPALFLCAPASEWLGGEVPTVAGGCLRDLD